MTEQEVKKLRIGDVVELNHKQYVVIATKSSNPPVIVPHEGYGRMESLIANGLSLPMYLMYKPREFSIFSQVISRQGKPVDKL